VGTWTISAYCWGPGKAFWGMGGETGKEVWRRSPYTRGAVGRTQESEEGRTGTPPTFPVVQSS
jgi:hypothetical protein